MGAKIFDKRKHVGDLEIRVTQDSISLHLHNKLNKGCIFYFKIRCLFVSSPLYNDKYFIQCNFARLLQHAFLITIYIWSDTVVLICVIASTCDVCCFVCQVSCAEMSFTCAFKCLDFLQVTSRIVLMAWGWVGLGASFFQKFFFTSRQVILSFYNPVSSILKKKEELSLLNALRSVDKHLCTNAKWWCCSGLWCAKLCETELSPTPQLFNI